MCRSSSPVGETNWGKVFLLREVPGSRFTCACTNMHELSGDIDSVQIHVAGKATKMKGVLGPGKSLVQNYDLLQLYEFTLRKL